MILEIPTTTQDLSSLDNSMAKMIMETINNMLIELYAGVNDKERATEVWDAIYKYYEQDLKYYNQYLTTNKADGVKALLQESAQLVYGLNQTAKEVLNDTERANKSRELLASYGFNI